MCSSTNDFTEQIHKFTKRQQYIKISRRCYCWVLMGIQRQRVLLSLNKISLPWALDTVLKYVIQDISDVVSDFTVVSVTVSQNLSDLRQQIYHAILNFSIGSHDFTNYFTG